MARTEKKGSAELRTSDLDEHSTRYDYLLAAPSDDDLTKYWTAWAVVSTLGGLIVAVIFFGVLSSKNARTRAFNVYLLYLMFPDAVYSILCGMVCMIHAINNRQVASMCNFQMMFIVWGVGSNMWLNAAVTHQLYSMLRGSNERRKYKVPTVKFVTKQALGIYVFTIFLGTLGLIESQKFPHYVASTSGLACLPVEQDWKSSLFFWLVFFPLFGAIPIAYITYVCFIVWKHKLLPPQGKRRLLVIYFGRIVVVFVLMWVPYMILLFMFATWMPVWVHFAGGTLSHLQGAVSAGISLLKPDLYFAVKRFVTCQVCCQGPEQSESDSSSWLYNFSATFSSRAIRSSLFRTKPRPNMDNSNTQEQRPDNPDEAFSFDEHHDALAESLWPDRNGEYSSSDTEAVNNKDEEEAEDKDEEEAEKGNKSKANISSSAEEEKEPES